MEIISEIQNTHLKILTDLYVKLEPFIGYFDEDCYYNFSYYWQPIESFKDDAVKYNLNTSSYVKLLDTFINEFKKEGYPNEDILELLKLKHDIINTSDTNGSENTRPLNENSGKRIQGHRTGEKPFVKWLKCDYTNQEDMIAKLMIEEVEKIRQQAANNGTINPRIATPVKCMLYALYELGLSKCNPEEGYDLSYSDRSMIVMHQSLRNFLGDFNTYKALADATKISTKIEHFKTIFSVVLPENLP